MTDNPAGMSFTGLEAQWKPLINKFSYKYVIPGQDAEDIAQELRVVLLKAQRTYDPDKGIKFITYLYKMFDSRIKNIWRDTQGRKKHVPHGLISPLDSVYYSRDKGYNLEKDNMELLAGLSANASSIASSILEGNTRRKDWLAAGMTKDEVKSGLSDLRLALKGGRK